LLPDAEPSIYGCDIIFLKNNNYLKNKSNVRKRRIKMISFNISLPETAITALGYRESEAGESLKKEIAVYFFDRNILTFGQARQLAEMPLWDFLDLLRERKVPLHYDAAAYENDLKTIREIG
jgi:predicted HTH domain antitoxin